MKKDSRIQKVYKYSFSLTELSDYVTLKIPRGDFLSVQNQRETLTFWFVVDPREGVPQTERKFRVCGTGHPIGVLEANRKFLGTVQFVNGDFVVHVFEITS